MNNKRLTTSLIPELSCSNIKNSLLFYTDVLGFTIQYQREEDGFAMLERQGSRIMLDEIRHSSATESNRTWISGTMEKPFGRGINLQINTVNVDELYARVKKEEVHIFWPIEERWYRADDVEIGHRQFIIQDPDGYLLRFFQDLGVRKTVLLSDPIIKEDK